MKEVLSPLRRTAWRRFGPGNLWATYALVLVAYAGGLVAVETPPNDDTIPMRVAVKQVTAGSRGGIASGAGDSCAIVDDGVKCWGNNRLGELGNNSTAASRLPVSVTGLAGHVQAIAAGADHTCALVNSGVKC